MNKLKCIVVDDEPLALGLIVSYVKKTPFLEYVEEFDNPIDAMEFLENNTVDLIFLDIHMPNLSGIEFAHILKVSTKIIFTTAYDQYALDGFKLDAIDYLLKPVSYEVFLKAALKAKRYFTPRESVGKEAEGKDHFFIKADYQVKRINYSDILYFEGLKDYVKLYLINSDKPIVFYSTMKALESKLPQDQFMRVHRSYIVALNKIKTIERDRIIFGNEYIPISKQFKGKFDQYIKEKFL